VDGMQENFSRCDNPMSLRVKKVAGIIAELVFLAKNAGFDLGNFYPLRLYLTSNQLLNRGFLAILIFSISWSFC
jgi:hypothetical protein